MSLAPSTVQHESQPTSLTPLLHPRPFADWRLPIPLTSLVGRDHECARISALLGRPDVRLLTLSGPAGVGKTRLALTALADLDADFPDGTWFVPLAAITDPVLFPAAIAQVLGVRETSGRSFADGLKARLRNAAALLLLDNLEQVLGAAPLIVDLLIACPALKVVVTSRATLHVAGEHDFAVQPLPLPDLSCLPSLEALAISPAVALFVARVRALQPDFDLNAENAPIIAELCHRLDGLPLAIELAAARAKIVPPAMLLARLSDRLQLLTGGCRDQPTRLQTLRNAIAWSYDLLTAEEQSLFRRLAVFIGGFGLDAAESVAEAEVLDLVASLVDKSLLRHVAGPGGEPRLAMLETIREFGLEQLDAAGETQATRYRHAAYFLALVERAAPPLVEKTQEAAWLDQLAADRDNLCAVLTWTSDVAAVMQMLRLTWAMWPFWLVHGRLSEGRHWLETAIAGGRGDRACADLLGKALYGAAWLALEQADDDAARAFGEESVALARDRGDREGIATALGPLGFLAHQQGDLDRAMSLHREALAIKRALGDDEGSAVTLTYLAHIALDRGDLDEAASLGQAALATHRARGKRRHVALTLDILGDVAYHQGDDSRASEHYEEALASFRDLCGKRDIASVLDHLGAVARRRAEHERAWILHAEALKLRRELGNAGGMAAWLEAVATVLACRRQHAPAARLFGTATALREQTGRPRSPLLERAYEPTLAGLRRGLGERAFAAAQTAGWALSLDQAVAEATAAMTDQTLGHGTTPCPFGLTGREHEVLRLLSRHLTDKEIAAALFISHRTVGRHVTNLFTKLGVHSRREAAASAQDHSLA